MGEVLADHTLLISHNSLTAHVILGPPLRRFGSSVSLEDADKKSTVEISLRLKVDEAFKHFAEPFWLVLARLIKVSITA